MTTPATALSHRARQRTTRSSPNRTHRATMASNTATSTEAANPQGSYRMTGAHCDAAMPM